MPSSGMLRRVALVRTDVSEERSVLNIGVTRTTTTDARYEETLSDWKR
jgi:hypothetical protein